MTDSPFEETKLSWMCYAEGCHNPKEGRTEYCGSCNKAQRKEEREASKPQKVSKPLKRTGYVKPVSDKRAIQLSEYNKRVKKWKEGKICLMCDWEGIKKPCEHAHHSEGREGDRLLDFTKLVPLCAKHHIWITEHSKEAIELGVSVSRNAVKKGDELY